MLETIVTDLACTGCGCLCDDLRVTVRENRIIHAQGACSLIESWLLNQNRSTPIAILLQGQPARHDDAIARAVDILGQARNPLIYGLSRSATAGQRAAVALADLVGGVIDTTASLCHAPSVVALQNSGESTCTLGEVKNRADLVVFWGADPMTSHPRHFERYSVDPIGEFVPQGRAGRTVIVVDQEPTASSERADLFLPIKQERNFEALWCLRAMLQDLPLVSPVSDELPMDALRDLAERMKKCRTGIVFFGLGLSQGRQGHRDVEALLRLTQELNAFTPFYARRLRVYGDVTGADSVLAWQTGYPFSVSLQRGYPRFNPGEFSAQELLEREEVDACVLLGSETVTRFSPAAQSWLGRIPTIVLDYPETECPFRPTVQFKTAVYGIHVPGVAYRMDEVPIPLRSCLTTTLPTDAAVLMAIHERLSQRPV